MSEATRSAALLHATAVHAGEGHEAVLVAAKKFDAFLTGGTATEAADKPAAKPAAKPATTAKPAAKPAAKKAPPADEGDEEGTVTKATRRAAAAAEADEPEEGAEGDEVTQEQVETAIADLLGANLRKQAVALLGEYGAKSASGVKAEDRAEFVQRASDLLLGS